MNRTGCRVGAAVLTVLARYAIAQTCSPEWLAGQGPPGADDVVLAFTSWDPDGPGPSHELLVAGGGFQVIGGCGARHIATWDGVCWRALGAGTNSAIHALTTFEGNLIAGGTFTNAGGAGALGVARWDGQAWSPIGGGLNHTVHALVVWNGQLVAGGYILSASGTPVNHIARWGGSQWLPLGPGMNDEVRALTTYQGDLVAVGDFTTAGGQNSFGVARWNGSNWSPMGTGLAPFGGGRAVAVYDGQLIAGGDFTGGVARWTGTAWEGLGANLTSTFALSVYDGRLYAGGEFNAAGAAEYLQRWDGSAWSAVGDGVDYRVYALGTHGSSLLVGGSFEEAGTHAAHAIARWDGQWSPMAHNDGLNDAVRAVAEYKGDLIAAGFFTEAGGAPMRHIARWADQGWAPLGAGLDMVVWVLGEYRGDLIAGGAYPGLVRWDGAAWHSFPSNMSPVTALTVFRDELIIGGSFSGQFGAGYLTGMVRWNGAAFVPFSQLLSYSKLQSPSVAALAVHDFDGPGPDPPLLVLGGSFYTAGGQTVNGTATWDGVSYRPLGAGIWQARTFATYNGELFTSGSTAITAIHRWTGSSWQPVPGAQSGAFDLVVHNGALVVAGSVSTPSFPFTGVAQWNGAAWLPMGSGVNDNAYALLSRADELVAAGDFSVAGGKASMYWARWGCPSTGCEADCDLNGFLTIEDFCCFNDRFQSGDTYSDCNEDGLLTVADFGCFQTRFVAGCP